MRNFILKALLEKPKMIKAIAVTVFLLIFLYAIITVSVSFSDSFGFPAILFIFLIIGFAFREYIVHLFEKAIKSIFPTTQFPGTVKKILDKFFSLGITLFFVGIGINPITMLIKLPEISELKLNYTFYALSLWVFIVYALAVVLTSAFFYYRNEYHKLRVSLTEQKAKQIRKEA